MNLDAAGGRRFLLSVGTLVSLVALKAFGRLADDPFVLALLGTVGGYITGNVLQRAIDAKTPAGERPIQN